MASEMLINSSEELIHKLKRISPGDYTIYNNSIYQISKIKSIHPGGEIIDLASGRDCTQLVQSYHPSISTQKIENLLKQSKVKQLNKSDLKPTYDNRFYLDLKARVQAKLKELNLNRHSYQYLATLEVLITVLLYLFCTIKIASVQADISTLGYVVLSGFLVGRLGMLMHMGGHRAISSSSKINYAIQLCMELVGGSSINWRYFHAYAHHVAPNEYQTDTDCKIGDPLIRLHPEIQWKPSHRYQAPLIISAMSTGILKWYFFDIYAYIQASNDTKSPIVPKKKDWIILFVSKILFMLLHIIWPAYNHNFVWAISTTVLSMVIASHFLYQIFIVNHIQEGLVPPKNVHWAIKNVIGSADWCSESHFANWISGGLNHQILHHLFPSISHWVYPQLVPVLKETCKDYKLPYNTYDSFWTAWVKMFRYLDDLGNNRIQQKKIL